MHLVLGLGMMEGVEVGIKNVEEAKSVVPVPCYFKDKTYLELEQLVSKNNFQHVECSGWVSPMIPVKKINSSIRICGDYKVTVNKVAKFDKI